MTKYSIAKVKVAFIHFSPEISCTVSLTSSTVINRTNKMIPIRLTAKPLVVGLMCSLAVLWGGRAVLSSYDKTEVLQNEEFARDRGMSSIKSHMSTLNSDTLRQNVRFTRKAANPNKVHRFILTKVEKTGSSTLFSILSRFTQIYNLNILTQKNFHHISWSRPKGEDWDIGPEPVDRADVLITMHGTTNPFSTNT
ncbi:hypothetical protein EB796_008650 [Bugula neritina]|uniref:Uncharacterized protein n=1 Tax=Bugula neritina TaxID=10212 RepID=A0A7J7K372_BUGNE|nr:hypothetical protein EB796_008650 [Bugula neritina]